MGIQTDEFPCSPTFYRPGRAYSISRPRPTFISIPDYIKAFPYPTHLNPHYEEAAAATQAWFASWGVLKKPHIMSAYQEGDWTLLAAFSVPDAPADRLRLISDYLCWLFLFDDLCDEGELNTNISATRDAGKLTLDILKNPDGASTSFLPVEILRDFWKRASPQMSPRVRNRFINTIESYLVALAQEIKCRIRDDFATVSVEEYIHLRRETSAVRTVLALMEFANGQDLPDEVVEHPTIVHMVQLANDMISWSNDIYSFNGEQAKGQTSNLVLVAMREHNLTIQDGIDFVDTLLRDAMAEYVLLRHSLPSWDASLDAEVQKFVSGLDHWILGAFKWSLGCERYFGKQFREVAKTLRFELAPRQNGLPSLLPASDVQGEQVPKMRVALGKPGCII